MSVRSAGKRGFNPRKTLRTAFAYGVLIFTTIVILIPVVWFVITAFKTDVEYNRWPIQFLPKDPQWENFQEVFAPRHRILRYARNSLFLAVTNTTLLVITSSMAGFAFAPVEADPSV